MKRSSKNRIGTIKSGVSHYDVMFGILVNIVLRLLSTTSLLVVDPLM